MFCVRISFVFLFLIAYQTYAYGTQNDKEKRLLLNDPDVIMSRLSHLEQQVQALTQQNTALTTQNQALTDTVTKLNQALTDTATIVNQTLANQNQQLTDTVTKLNASVIDMDRRLQRNSQDNGITYIRWGRNVCDGVNTEVVYRGYTAGQNYHYSESEYYRGGPSDYLCLPDNPQISNETFEGKDILIFGTEYEANYFAPDSHNEDAPCVLCRKTTASTVVMIPGRQTCYDGWNLEYKGYLGGGHMAHTASSFICVDSKPEYIPSGQANMNGHLVYVVGYQCGPLPCPPYHDNRKVNCVVCSK